MRKGDNVGMYRGVVIFRSTTPGYALPYTARLSDGTPLAADSLEGIKQSIRGAKESKSC